MQQYKYPVLLPPGQRDPDIHPDRSSSARQAGEVPDPPEMDLRNIYICRKESSIHKRCKR